MQKLILFIVLSFVSFVSTDMSASARDKKLKPEKPDMEKIKKEVNDSKSKYYYPKLMEMYEANDTIMQLDGFRYLYLGYIFQEDYDPYRRSEFGKRVEEQYYKTDHTKSECDSIIKYAEMSLKDDPFDLRQMTYLIYAYRTKQKVNLAKIWQYKLNHLIEAIVSTGTGLDADNAWIVINPKHEYDIINFQGYVAESQKFEPPHYDYISVKPKDETDATKGFYFNILYILQEYYRKHPEE